MKEATGELVNLIVVLICVAILVAFFYFTVWPIIKQNFESQTACEKAICETTPNDDGLVKCRLKDGDNIFLCKYKG